jgi:hypothetical protein
MAEKLNNFEKFERKKKNQISALFSTQTSPDDCLTIGLVASKYIKLEKKVKI